MNKFLSNKWFIPMLAPDPAGGSGGGDPSGGDPAGNDPEGKDPEGGGGEGGNEPKFTQEQLNSYLAAERKKASAGAFKEFGFKTADEAKTFIEKYRAEEDKNKSELEKAQGSLATTKDELKAEQLKAQNLEYKFEAISQGCAAADADDVVTLAKGRMSDTTDFKTALEEVKKAYPAMFDDDSQSPRGTGKGGNPPRQGGGKGIDGIGKRLATGSKKPSSNPYFKG
jgi:hypothetical protein